MSAEVRMYSESEQVAGVITDSTNASATDDHPSSDRHHELGSPDGAADRASGHPVELPNITEIPARCRANHRMS